MLPNDIFSILSGPLERFESGILRFSANFRRELYHGVYSPKGTNFRLLYILILSEKKIILLKNLSSLFENNPVISILVSSVVV